jgi:hypothetical protein
MRGTTVMLLMLVACSETATPRKVAIARELAGVYSFVADSARECTEGSIPYPCSCRPPGRYEGTLTITSQDTTIGGSLRFRECLPDQTPECGAEAQLPIITGYQFLSDTVVQFTLGHLPMYGGDGGWINNGRRSSTGFAGKYQRWDGSPRNCGSDYGSFVASRQ